MRALRVGWLLLAIAATAAAVFAAAASVGSSDLSCSKTGSTGVAEYSCDDPILQVVGPWPFLVIGLALAVPPVLAGVVVARRWVAWLAALALMAAGAWGVGHWASHWGTLMFGLPMAVVAAGLAALGHWVVHDRRTAVGRAHARSATVTRP